MRMPEMDGAEFLGKVAAKWPWAPRAPPPGPPAPRAPAAAPPPGKIYRYISKPWEEADLKLTVQGVLEQRFLEQERRRLEKLTYVQNEELQELNARLEDKVAQRTQELATANEALHANHMLTIKGFSNMIEAREPLLAGHSQRVADMSKRLASKLGMNAPQVQELCHAALLHDIGKIGLPDHLLTKPYEELKNGELERVRSHAVTAQSILMALDALHEVGLIIRSHHELYDGTGYPDALIGEAIPLASRILAIANDYDALQIGTLTAQKMNEDQARRHITSHSGSMYDPAVAQQFLSVLDEIQEQEGRRHTILKSGELENDMVLARDLVTKDDNLLLSNRYILDEKKIKKNQVFERLIGAVLEVHICVK